MFTSYKDRKIPFITTLTSETLIDLSVCPSNNYLYFVCPYLPYGNIEVTILEEHKIEKKSIYRVVLWYSLEKINNK